MDNQLVNLRTYNIDPRALSHDKAGLRSKYSFEKAGNNRRSDEMLKTGQVPMDVNAMPRLVLEESDDECSARRRGLLFLQEDQLSE